MKKRNQVKRAHNARGGEVTASAVSSYMGASLTQREIASWQPGFGSADADILPDLSMLMSRSRDLERNNGIADGGSQTLSDNIVGTGLTLRPNPDYAALGKTKEWAQQWSRQVASLWRSHADTTDVDAARSLNLAGLCTQALRGAISNGDAVGVPLWVPRAGSRFSTCLQLIEADRLSNPYGQIDTTNLRGGIELDDRGGPVAYWIRKQHPGDIYLSFMSPKIWEWDRIPAETAWGRKRVLHLHDKERTGQILAYELKDQLQMLVRRMEWMAAQELQTGSVTVSGDNYPAQNVNFGRNAAQTIVLTGGARWGQTGVAPLDLLQTWALIVLQQIGSMPIDVVMDVGAWKVFRADPTVSSRLTLQRTLGQLPTMKQDAQLAQGGTYMGTIDNFNIWVYSDWYVDDTGTEQPMLPNGTVIMAGQVLGVRAYGAIRDEEAGYQALPFFSKSWVLHDPAVRYLLLQSAPLPVPYRVDATLCATVL